MNAEELWRPVRGFDGLYEVSSFGRVRSVARTVISSSGVVRVFEGRVLSAAVIVGKYYRVQLWRNNKAVPKHVHRLVAEAFLDGSGEVVRHLDGDGFNNRPENLAWGSHQDNADDMERHGRVARGERRRKGVLTDDEVREIRRLRSLGHTYAEIGAAIDRNAATVRCAARKETWKHV